MKLILCTLGIAISLLVIKPAIAQAKPIEAPKAVIYQLAFNPLTAAPGTDKEALIKSLKACGLEPVQDHVLYLIPLDKLNCPGLLESNALLINEVRKQAFEALDSIPSSKTDPRFIELRKRMENVQVIMAPLLGIFLSTEIAGNPRAFAVNIPEKNLIIFNEANIQWITSYNFGRYMVLHEYFGALGFHDLNYSSTLRMWQLHDDPTSKEKVDSLFDSFGNGADNPLQDLQRSGEHNGSTIVGHGGDFMELLFKIMVLSELDNPAWKQTKPQRDSIQESRSEIEAAIIDSVIISIDEQMLKDSKLCVPSYIDPKVEICSLGLYSDMLNSYTMNLPTTWEQDLYTDKAIHMIRSMAVDFVSSIVCKKHTCVP